LVHQEGVIVYANPEAASLLGANGPEQLVGGAILDSFAPESHDFIAHGMREIQRGGRVSIDASDERILTRSGECIDVQASIGTLVFDGRPAIHVLLRDGRDRKPAELALRESEARYRTIVENAPEAIVVLDVDSQRFIDVNENAVRLFKRSREELLELGPAQVSPPQQPDGRTSERAAEEMIERALIGGAPVFDWTHRDAEGRDVPCEIRLVRLPSSTGMVVRGSITDVSDRRELEARLLQSEKMEAIGKLAGGIAHDFNNILTAIQGFAELALREVEPGSQPFEDLEEIQRASLQGAALTAQLLAFGRRQVLQPVLVDLNQVVTDSCDLLRRVIGEDVELITNLDPKLGSVITDPAQMERIILNIAVNARDAMPEGGRITIETRNQAHAPGGADGSSEYVLLSIIDTGIGMDPETRNRVFEPFFTTKGRKGSGLGLATVYGIVEQSGGFIECESQPGGGTTFKLHFPRSRDAVAPADRPREIVAGGSETILVAEDERAVRDFTARALQSYGYTVLEAADAEAAARLADRHRGEIAMLVTDLVMPGASGRQLADRLVAARPGIKVLFISGYAEELFTARSALQPGVAFLQKPFTARALAAKVREVLC
jgi:PAS domain S-box-containing protein